MEFDDDAQDLIRAAAMATATAGRNMMGLADLAQAAARPLERSQDEQASDVKFDTSVRLLLEQVGHQLLRSGTTCITGAAIRDELRRDASIPEWMGDPSPDYVADRDLARRILDAPAK